MNAKETIYETKISDARWWAYDVPGNAGWILYLACLFKNRKRGLNAFNLASNHGTSRYDFVFAGTSGINVDSYGQLQYGYFTTSGGNATRRLPSAHFPVMAKATLSH